MRCQPPNDRDMASATLARAHRRHQTVADRVRGLCRHENAGTLENAAFQRFNDKPKRSGWEVLIRMTDCAPDDMTIAASCHSSLTEIRVLVNRVSASLAALSVPAALQQDAAIVLTEVLSNIVRHGYAGRSGQILCRVNVTSGGLDFCVMDRGCAYDPTKLGLSAPPPETLAEGGYGWFLIRRLTTGITYQRLSEQNCLKFQMTAHPTKGEQPTPCDGWAGA